MKYSKKICSKHGCKLVKTVLWKIWTCPECVDENFERLLNRKTSCWNCYNLIVFDEEKYETDLENYNSKTAKVRE